MVNVNDPLTNLSGDKLGQSQCPCVYIYIYTQISTFIREPTFDFS